MSEGPGTVPANRPRRVHQVVTQREPAGAQSVAHQLCQGMRRRGVCSDLVFLYRREDAFTDEDYADLRASRPGPFGTIGLVVALTRRLRRDQPDAVIAHTFHANVITSLAGALARVPRVVVVHHVLAEEEAPARRLVLQALRRLRLLGREVFVSQTTRDGYGPRAERGGAVVHNGVEVPSTARVEPRWGADPRRDLARPLVLAVGRLAPQKDHRTLLDAMRSLAEVDLAIVGEGPLRPELEDLVRRWSLSDRVTLVGNIEPAEVPAALHAADLVVQPSLWEAFSMVVLEAMAAGRALVVSDIAAHREALGDGAPFHPVGDAEALAQAVRAVLGDAARRAELESRNRARADGFGVEAMVEHYLRLVGA